MEINKKEMEILFEALTEFDYYKRNFDSEWKGEEVERLIDRLREGLD